MLDTKTTKIVWIDCLFHSLIGLCVKDWIMAAKHPQDIVEELPLRIVGWLNVWGEYRYRLLCIQCSLNFPTNTRRIFCTCLDGTVGMSTEYCTEDSEF